MEGLYELSDLEKRSIHSTYVNAKINTIYNLKCQIIPFQNKNLPLCQGGKKMKHCISSKKTDAVLLPIFYSSSCFDDPKVVSPILQVDSTMIFQAQTYPHVFDP